MGPIANPGTAVWNSAVSTSVLTTMPNVCHYLVSSMDLSPVHDFVMLFIRRSGNTASLSYANLLNVDALHYRILKNICLYYHEFHQKCL